MPDQVELTQDQQNILEYSRAMAMELVALLRGVGLTDRADALEAVVGTF